MNKTIKQIQTIFWDMGFLLEIIKPKKHYTPKYKYAIADISTWETVASANSKAGLTILLEDWDEI